MSTIPDDIKALKGHAMDKGWYLGAPLRDFELPELNDFDAIGSNSYSDLFDEWKLQIRREPYNKELLRQYYWAWQYLWAINCLIKGKKDGEPFQIDEVSTDALKNEGFDYPSQATEFDYLYDGILLKLGFTIPKDKRGHRLFVTGIERQSGFCYSKYAEKFVKSVIKSFDNNYENVIAGKDSLESLLINQNIIAKSYFLRKENAELDYGIVVDFYIKLSETMLMGLFSIENIDELSDYFDLPVLVTERILKLFKEETQTQLANFGLMLVEGNIHYDFPAVFDFSIYGLGNADAFLKFGNSELIHYRCTGDKVWKGIPYNKAVDIPKITLKFKHSQTVREIDITPDDLLEDPIIIFNDKYKHVPKQFPLNQRRSYYLSLNSRNWENSYKLYFYDKEGVEVIQNYKGVHFINAESYTGIAVKDENDQILYIRNFKGRLTLDPEISEDYLLPFVPGKRTYSKFPEIFEKDIIQYDQVNLYKGDQCVFTESDVSIPMDLDGRINESLSGKFILEVILGERSAKRYITVLPVDFEIEGYTKQYNLYETVIVKMSSNDLRPNRIECQISPYKTSFQREVQLKDGTYLTFNGDIKRMGAVVEYNENRTIFDIPEKAEKVNSDDLVHKGYLNVKSLPGSVIRIRFSKPDGKYHDYIKQTDKKGCLQLSFPEIRQSSSPGLWDNCNQISIFHYISLDKLIPGGVVHVESFSQNEFDVLIYDIYGGLVIEKLIFTQIQSLHNESNPFTNLNWDNKSLKLSEISQTKVIESIGVVVCPIDKQDKAMLLFLPDSIGGKDFDKEFDVIHDGFSISKNERKARITIPEFNDKYSIHSGCIVFLVKVDDKHIQRLSRGGYVEGLDPREGHIFAFDDLVSDSELEKRLNDGGELVNSFLDGVLLNAKLLDANNYFSIISAINLKEVSGFAFRAVDYWMQSLKNYWLLKHFDIDVKYMDDAQTEKIDLLDEFWDRELFDY
ncbi:MAG: hypothetical protein HRT89_21400, partial [Lentisphaeria bacterium]|nr:hypothetical protein [Lentisphaeria bacterium]